MIDEARRLRVTDIFKLDGNVYAFDTTTIDLCLKRLFRIHMSDAMFVVGAKTNMKNKVVKWKRRLPKNILSDCEIELIGFYARKNYPETIRMVRYWDEEGKREFTYLTNAKNISALQAAEMYKNRWQVELFFKWLKQHLRIKKFWGTTENAVRIQIYTAITTYCLDAIMQRRMHLDR